MELDEIHALITLEEMEAYLNLGDSQTVDPIINFFINGVSGMFEDECGGRVFIEATYSSLILDGNGKKQLYIPHYPITSIATVEEDDVALTVGRLNDFVIYGDEGEGYLWKVSGVWDEGVKNIELTDLVAGYAIDAVPDKLKQACCIQVQKEFQKYLNKAGAEETRIYADAAITWNFEMDEYVKTILEKFRRRHI